MLAVCLSLSACSKKEVVDPAPPPTVAQEQSDVSQPEAQPAKVEKYVLTLLGNDGKVASIYHTASDVTHHSGFGGNYYFIDASTGKTVWISDKFLFTLTEDD